jgi:hypothetical protein
MQPLFNDENTNWQIDEKQLTYRLVDNITSGQNDLLTKWVYEGDKMTRWQND